MTELQRKITSAFDALELVQNVSASTGKQEILKLHADNDVLKTILFITYNPFIQYFIRKVPEVPPVSRDEVSEVVYNEFLQLLCKFKERQLTGNAALDALTAFLSTCNAVEQKWYTRVIQRDIKCGIADKSINRAFPGLVPTYEVLLADKFDAADLGLDTPKALKLLPSTYICEPKLDGMRLNIYNEEGKDPYICSRNGKLIFGYNALLREVAEKLPKGYVYDGELMSLAFEQTLQKAIDGTVFEHPESDCFNSLMTAAFSHADNKEGVYNLFDAVPIDEWKKRTTTQPLSARKAFISTLKNLDLTTIKIVEWSPVFHQYSEADRQRTVELLKYFVSIGYEGLMVKDYTAKYEFKRSKTLLKMKFMDSDDLEVTGVYEGNKGSKYEGMLGGVYCDYKGYTVGVGSGWSDEERQLYWQHPELIVGKTIEVWFQNESNNQDGGVSIRFPIKKCIRQDK